MNAHRWTVTALLCLVVLASTAQTGGGSAAVNPRAPSGVHTIEGTVVGVHDGDTITLLDVDKRQHKIRLDGIDAPELGQPNIRVSTQGQADEGVSLAAQRAKIEAWCSLNDAELVSSQMSI